MTKTTDEELARSIRDIEPVNEPETYGSDTLVVAWTYEERTRRSQRLVTVVIFTFPGSEEVFVRHQDGKSYPISNPERYGPASADIDTLREWAARFRLNRPHPLSN